MPISTTKAEKRTQCAWLSRTPPLPVDVAVKRIWVMLPRIEDSSCAEKLVDKATVGVDVRILVGDWGSLASAIDRLARELDNVADRFKRKMKIAYNFKEIFAGIIAIIVMALAAYVGISLWYPSIMPFGTPITWAIAIAILILISALIYPKMDSRYLPFLYMETYRYVQAMREALGWNLKTAIAPINEIHYELYIIDEAAWAKVGDRWIYLDVKEAEARFTERWEKYANESPIFKLFGNIAAAKKRIWIAMREAGHPLGADLFVRKAAEGADVRIIVADDFEDLVRMTDYYAGLIEDTKVRMYKLIAQHSMIGALGLTLIVAPLAYIAFYMLMPVVANSVLPIFVVAYPLLFISYIFSRNNLANIKEEIKRIEAKYGETLLKFEESSLKRNLHIIKGSITDELYIVDESAWMRYNDKLKKVDVYEVEKKFIELLNSGSMNKA